MCVVTRAEGSTISNNDARESYEEKDLVSVMVGGMVLLRKNPEQQAACEIRNG